MKSSVQTGKEKKVHESMKESNTYLVWPGTKWEVQCCLEICMW